MSLDVGNVRRKLLPCQPVASTSELPSVTRNTKPVFTFFTDKICDQISDAVLDAHLKQDPDGQSRMLVSRDAQYFCGCCISRDNVAHYYCSVDESRADNMHLCFAYGSYRLMSTMDVFTLWQGTTALQFAINVLQKFQEEGKAGVTGAVKIVFRRVSFFFLYFNEGSHTSCLRWHPATTPNAAQRPPEHHAL